MIAFAFVTPDGLPRTGGMRPVLPEGAIVLPAPFTTTDLPRLRWTGEAWVWRDDPVQAQTEAEVAADAADALVRAKVEAVARINQRTGRARLRVYTDIPGQDALYLEKRDEALRFVGLWQEPLTLDDFPLLAAEIGITAPTPWQLAQIWLHRADQFKAFGAATERARQQALAALETAPDLAAIDQIEAAFIATLGKLPV